jgi:hypothetical protein
MLFLISTVGVFILGTHSRISNVLPENTNSDFIEWSAIKKLNWDMFRAIHPPKGFEHHDAPSVTFRQMENYSEYEDSLVFELKSYFNTKLSWKSRDNSFKLLNHEQRHFDIQEVITRRMRKELQNHKILYGSTGMITMRWIEYQQKNTKLFMELSNLYDIETKHGTVSEKQKEWDIKIDSMLYELNDYASAQVITKR